MGYILDFISPLKFSSDILYAKILQRYITRLMGHLGHSRLERIKSFCCIRPKKINCLFPVMV